jgi:hypothetical protein
MGTYENFYLNQIKQLQEENKKLKQIIDEGIVGAGVRKINGVIPQGWSVIPERSGPVVPGRIDPKVAETLDRQIGDRRIGFGPTRKKEKPYASDDMESRRTQPGYGPSSDSQGAGPKYDVMQRMVDEKIRRARERGFDYRF